MHFHRYQRVSLSLSLGIKEAHKQMDYWNFKNWNLIQRAYACNRKSFNHYAKYSPILSVINAVSKKPTHSYCTRKLKHLKKKINEGKGGRKKVSNAVGLESWDSVKCVKSLVCVLIPPFPFYSNKDTSQSGVCWKRTHFFLFPIPLQTHLPTCVSGSCSGLHWCLQH